MTFHKQLEYEHIIFPGTPIINFKPKTGSYSCKHIHGTTFWTIVFHFETYQTFLLHYRKIFPCIVIMFAMTKISIIVDVFVIK
jgi:hypothetical protein